MATSQSLITEGERNPDQDGFQKFGKGLMLFTILTAIVILAIIIAGFMSMAGVFSHDVIAPPV